MKFSDEEIGNVLIHQLNNFWGNINEDEIRTAVPTVVESIRSNYSAQVGEVLTKDGINPYNSTQWSIFLYRMSRFLYVNKKDNNTESADVLFYLNKILNSVNWNYKAELPPHFLCEHPLGSVLGRAKYGDFLFIYQGVTVGGNRTKNGIIFPNIGNNVIVYSDAKIIGESYIGNNVVIAANTYIFNSIVPDNCVVSGVSPNLIIKEKDEAAIKRYTSHIWKW